jgi:hypothetical protein
MVRQNNIPLPSEERHADSKSRQILAESELTCKQVSQSHKILEHIYMMLMNGTHKLMINTRQQGIRKGMQAQLRMTTYKLCQNKTHLSNGIHRKSDDITLPSGSEN